MKNKMIFGLLVLATMLMAAGSASADGVPSNFTDLGPTGLTGTAAAYMCADGSIDGEVYCVGSGSYSNDIIKWDPVTGNATSVQSLAAYPHDAEVAVAIFDDKLYIHTYADSTAGPYVSLVYDPALDTLNTLTTMASVSNVSGNTANARGYLRPGTDQIVSVAGSSGDDYYEILMYDISEDSWTAINNELRVNHPLGTSNGSNWFDCAFENTDKLWCFGGYGGGANLDTLWTYDIEQNTLEQKGTLADPRAGTTCRFYQDVFYCWGGEDSTYDTANANEVLFYDPADDTSGVSTNVSGFAGWNTCMTYDETTDYCIGGYDSTYSTTFNAWSMTWPEIQEEAPAPSSSSGSRTQYAVDADGNVVGVYQGGNFQQVENTPEPTSRAPTLSIGNFDASEFRAWLSDLWNNVQGWFVQ